MVRAGGSTPCMSRDSKEPCKSEKNLALMGEDDLDSGNIGQILGDRGV